ncbi:Integral membrane protein OS=Streptomyces antimycoticus OX=68175 GN=SSPO_081690 PE=4 SV=1 [Streptomyces antimycoticus]
MNFLIGVVVLGTVVGGRIHQTQLEKRDGSRGLVPPAPPPSAARPTAVLPHPGGSG